MNTAAIERLIILALITALFIAAHLFLPEIKAGVEKFFKFEAVVVDRR